MSFIVQYAAHDELNAMRRGGSTTTEDARDASREWWSPQKLVKVDWRK